MHRFPNGADRKASGTRSCPSHAPDWLTRWDNPDADPGETLTYLVVDEPAALVWAANFGALEWHAWTSRVEDPHRPTYALIDLDPGERDHVGRTCWPSRGCTGPRFEHLGVDGAAEADRPARHPDLGTDRAAARRSTRPARGSSGCRGPSARSCPSWSAGSGRSATAAGWPGWTTPRTPSTRPWSRPTARGPRRARRSRRRSSGTSSTTRRCGPTASRSGPCCERIAERGDLFAPVLTTRQRLPPLH